MIGWGEDLNFLFFKQKKKKTSSIAVYDFVTIWELTDFFPQIYL